MGDIVNLRRARKSKARQDAADKASANRASFGRTGDEKRSTATLRLQADRRLDGHRLATGEDALSEPAQHNGNDANR
jgi:hypothetical protein